MDTMTLEELKAELRRGSRVALMVRHGERPKMDANDPSFGDALALTYEGRRTSTKLGRLLKEFAGEVQFYASPLTRTRMTAECIAAGMDLKGLKIPVEDLLGNSSFYYADARDVLEVFKPANFFPACEEYFRKGEQRGFRNLYSSTDAFEKWIDENWKSQFFIISTHDLYIAAFLCARKIVTLTRENWIHFLDGAAIIVRPDGTRRYAVIRTGLSSGIVGVRPPKIEGVVFDFGGVMTTSTMPERVRACVKEFGIDWSHLERGFSRYRHLLDGGFVDIDTMYDLIWADADIKLEEDVHQRILAEDFASFLENYRNEDTLKWMKELKSAGYKIGILTNMPPSLAARFREVYADFVALADAMVISGEERMFKPQQRIYKLLQERIGLPAENLCFVDDVDENCEGARRAGWHCVQFSTARQAAQDFADL